MNKSAPQPAKAQATRKSVIAELWPGQSLDLLKALHILTREGELNADSRRKLKQVLHLVQLLRPALDRAFERKSDLRLADLGAGKSYLGFILYDLIFAKREDGNVIAVEARAELIEAARDLATRASFSRMSFLSGQIEDINCPHEIDVVTALHACDTATDEAIRFALRHQARTIALVPCCQAELARLLEGEGTHSLHQLWRHPIQRREFASVTTNAIRALFLEAHGYKVRVTELVGLEHSMKNELILAERHQLSNAAAKAELIALLRQLPVHPALVADFVPSAASNPG
ncbi:MAG: class I SAM-dependent methyltransferase [Burkholderiales bacterium]